MKKAAAAASEWIPALWLGWDMGPLAHTSSHDTDLTRNTRAPHFTPQHWLLCPMGLY